MNAYYSTIIMISIGTLVVLSILVHENERVSKRDKRYMYATCILITLAALSEWAGAMISGNPSCPELFLRLVKTLIIF